jgi:hypothetical protein
MKSSIIETLPGVAILMIDAVSFLLTGILTVGVEI